MKARTLTVMDHTESYADELYDVPRSSRPTRESVSAKLQEYPVPVG